MVAEYVRDACIRIYVEKIEKAAYTKSIFDENNELQYTYKYDHGTIYKYIYII